jgi:hypothetical protein
LQRGFAAAPAPASIHAHRLVGALGWALLALFAANTLLYVARAANPLVISDAWYYVDHFVRKAAAGDLTPGDFFAKRTSVDHSLPLHKLLLLANYRLFDLDLSVDAWVGTAFAIATVLLLRRALRQATGPAFFTLPVQLAFGALAAVYLSLNASVIYEWPLLTMGFCTQFFFVLLFLACWRSIASGRFVGLLLAAMAALVVADGGGLIATAAAAAGCALQGLRAGPQRRTAWRAVALLVVAAVVYKVGYALLAPPYTHVPVDGGLGALFGPQGAGVHLLAWIRIPLVASVLLPAHVQGTLVGGALAQALLALLLAAAHLAFWWQVFTRKPTAATHVATCLMLLFYGLWAGVLLARVPTYGDAAFAQPRYVIFYQLQLVALLLVAAARLGDARPAGRRWLAGGVVAASLVLFLVQLPAGRDAWRRAPYERRYVAQLAQQMDALAARPDAVPPACLPQLTVCRMPPSERQAVMGFLVQQRLNLFATSVRQAHGLPPAP